VCVWGACVSTGKAGFKARLESLSHVVGMYSAKAAHGLAYLVTQHTCHLTAGGGSDSDFGKAGMEALARRHPRLEVVQEVNRDTYTYCGRF
jgi:hypothetical protein